MNREIVFSDKLLWAGLVGLLAGAYALGAGEGWFLAVVASVMSGFVVLIAISAVLTPIAEYLVARNIEGKSRGRAGTEVVLGALLVLVCMALAHVFRSEINAVRALFKTWVESSFLLSLALLVLGILGLLYGVYDTIKTRRERTKMKTVDLSRSRDLRSK